MKHNIVQLCPRGIHDDLYNPNPDKEEIIRVNLLAKRIISSHFLSTDSWAWLVMIFLSNELSDISSALEIDTAKVSNRPSLLCTQKLTNSHIDNVTSSSLHKIWCVLISLMELRQKKPPGYYRNLTKSSLDIRTRREKETTWNKDDAFDIKVRYFNFKQFQYSENFHIPYIPCEDRFYNCFGWHEKSTLIINYRDFSKISSK